jgi:hypothetical protein
VSRKQFQPPVGLSGSPAVSILGRQYSGLRPKCRRNLIQIAIGLRDAVVDPKKQDGDCDDTDDHDKLERHGPIIQRNSLR